MPIYAYRCSTCGHAKDVLRKISDPVLSVCPACGAPTFMKQVTAAGFQLKGSGWYATDFRGDSKAPKPAGDEGGDAAKPAAAPAAENGSDKKAAETAKPEPGAAAAPAASPAPAPAKPAPGPAPSSGQ